MNVLLVWDENPEKIKFFIFQHGSEMHELCKLSNNLYINADDLPDDHPLYQLNEKLTEYTALDTPLAGYHILEVYKAGFMM